MKVLWYGDRRDLVKQGALVHLAKKNKIRWIIQVAYLRHLKLQTEEGEEELPKEVCKHFFDLMHIKRLADATRIEIIQLDETFDPTNWPDYIDKLVSKINEINSRKIIFLDPDTGIEPNEAKAEHVSERDIKEIWNHAVSNGDLLALYQHADRTKNWLTQRMDKMSRCCGGAKIGTITGTDITSVVAMLCCCKGSKNKERRSCACQCGKIPVGGYFWPGHDARLKSIFLRIGKGEESKKGLDKIRLRMYEIWERDKSRQLKEIAKEVLG